MCFIFHDWDKWIEYEYHYSYLPRYSLVLSEEDFRKLHKFKELRQKRFCIRCGIRQDRIVRKDV